MILNMKIEAIENEIRRMFHFVVTEIVKCKLQQVADLMKLMKKRVTMKHKSQSLKHAVMILEWMML
jgi:hypothetical protein